VGGSILRIIPQKGYLPLEAVPIGKPSVAMGLLYREQDSRAQKELVNLAVRAFRYVW
jgi:hypothetical protein